MGAADFLQKLAGEGIAIVGNGDCLLVGPRDRLTDDHRQRIADLKAELLELVEHRNWMVILPDCTVRYTCPQGMTRAEALQCHAHRNPIDARPIG